MVFRGIVLEYNTVETTGVVMLSNGKKKEFTLDDLADENIQLSIHQRITYVNDESPMQIRTLQAASTQQFPVNPASQSLQKKNSTPDAENKFTNVDDCLNYFTAKGFKKIRESQDGETSTFMLRSYSVDSFGEVIIKASGSNIKVTQTLNGKPVL